ncbi:uncharacterized protein LOC108669226, partial [Hyalella azteca]|uniref:Uncharacterized protein LOC108669226 n=1 Tax=Hyalella azteca TaxID=294128 RepID=A0A8B7NEI5_HYAAZ
MISKQINRSTGVGNSNITLDCRNVQGEKRRRSCIFTDEEDPFRNIDQDPEIIPTVRPTHRGELASRRVDPVPMNRAALSRRKILNKYETELPSIEREPCATDDLTHGRNCNDYRMTVMRATPSSEEYDSGVNFRLDSSQDTLENFPYDQPKSFPHAINSYNSGSTNNFSSMPYGGRFYSGGNSSANERHSLAYNGYGADATDDRGNGIHAVTMTNSARSATDFLRGGREEFVAVTANSATSEQAQRRSEGFTACTISQSTAKTTRNVVDGNVKSAQLRVTATENVNSYSGLNPKYVHTNNFEKRQNNNNCELTTKIAYKGTNGTNEPLKSNLKSSCGDKMNSSLDYRSTMNQDANNRYSNNWNEMILNNQVNLKYNVKYDACDDAKMNKTNLTKSTDNVFHKTQHQNPGRANSRMPCKNEVNFHHNELQRFYDGRDCRLSPKKYNRSKSLDRKYLEDSSEDESDFEAHRRFERERRYARNPEWDALRLRNYENRLRRCFAMAETNNSKSLTRIDGRHGKVNWETALTTDIALQHRSPLMARPKLKAKSAWDLSRFDGDACRQEEQSRMLQKTRAGLRSRWQNIDKKIDDGTVDEAQLDRDLPRKEIADLDCNAALIRRKVEYRTENHAGIGNRFDDHRTPVGRRKMDKVRNAHRDEAHAGKANEAINTAVTNNVACLSKIEQWRKTEIRETSPRRNEFHESRKFAKEQWRRRSCDFELDGPSVSLQEPMSLTPLSLDRKRWYRRSCDLDLDFDHHYPNKDMISDYDLDNDLLSRTIQQFQSLPPYQEGLSMPEEIIVEDNRCVGRREEHHGARVTSQSSHNLQTSDDVGKSVHLSQEEKLLLDSGHEMLLLDRSRIAVPLRVDGRSKSRMEDNWRYRNDATELEEGFLNSKNSSKNGKLERPKTSIGHYGKEKRDRNRSTPHVFKDSLCSSLEQVCELSRSSSHRRRYAQLRPDSMGVNLHTGPVTHLDNRWVNLHTGPVTHLDNSHEESLLNEANQAPPQRQLQKETCYPSASDTTTPPLSFTDPSQDDDDNPIEMGRYDNNNKDNNKPDLIEDVARRQKQHLSFPQVQDRLEYPDLPLKDQFVDVVKYKQEEDNNEHKEEDCQKDVARDKISSDDKSPGLLEGVAGDNKADQEGDGIPHMTAGEGQELYALPMKSPRAGDGAPETSSVSPSSSDSPEQQQALPPGWEKHEDNDGAYYWHIKSGTITRTPPTAAPRPSHPPPPSAAPRRIKEEQVGVPRSTTSSALAELAELRPRSTNTAENAYKRRSYPVRSELSEAGCGRAVRFAVRSLGWLEVPEEELTPERSSKAVNRCIVDLSMGRRDVMDVVGCWGEGKDLFMDLDEGSLKLVDPENLTLLNTQPIHTIRVWGVGRDNGRERDFAYVARDRVSRKHMCHVFRCDTPARTIANTLRDICKKIMIERSLNQAASKGDLGSHMGSSNSLAGANNNNNNNNNSAFGRAARPCNLPTEGRRVQRHNSLLSGQSFPTPMEEPRKLVKAEYVGALQVSRPSGMEVINRAIQDAVNANPGPWTPVNVAVAPSTITVTHVKDNSVISECRVRFLSFLGIGRNVHHCAFIVHNAQDQFVAHVFFCEPSSGALCKTIEAACKLRYQKCLDAHPTLGGGSGGAGDTLRV